MRFKIVPNAEEKCFDVTITRPGGGSTPASNQMNQIAPKDLASWLRDLANQNHIAALNLETTVGVVQEPVYLGKAVSA